MSWEAKESSRLGLSEVEKLTSVARTCQAGPDSVRPEGEYFVAAEPNSFGLPAVDTCPGRTPFCERDCYAIDAERRTVTHEKLLRNHSTLQNAETVEGMTDKVRELVSDYKARADKLNIAKDARRFRFHWSGDFYSTDYAVACRTVIEENSDIRFYTYTRSYQPNVDVLPILSGLQNLDLFISVDPDNVGRASEVIGKYPDVRVAYLVDYYEDAAELADRMGRGEGYRSLACPENIRKENGDRVLPIISSNGGACSRCTYCIDKPSNWDVVFVKKGQKFRVQPELPLGERVPIEISPRKHQRDGETVQPLGIVAVGDSQASLF